jgi:hypothetical protein
MNKLPNEILTEIVSYLDTKNKIKTLTLFKSWFFAVVPLLWSKIICHLDDWEPLKKLFSKRRLYQDYRSSIKILHFISHSISLQSRLPNVKVVLQGCSQLTELVFEIPTINDDDLWILATHCKNLSKLSLVSSAFNHGSITDQGLSTIANNAKKLKHLMLRYLSVDCISERGILAIANGFQGQLKTFGLEYQDQRMDSGEFDTIMQHPGSFPSPIPSPIPFLSSSPNRFETYVDLAGGRRRFVEALILLVQSHASLERFALDWPVDDSLVLEALGKELHNLVVLKLGNTSSIPQLQSILTNNPKLQWLSLYEVNLFGFEINDILKCLIGPLPLLKNLELHGVCQFSNCVDMIPQFHQLESLVFSPTTRTATLNPFHTISIDTIAQHCRCLKRVEVPIHDNQSLISLATHCPLIHTLAIQDGRAIDAHGLTIMCTRLKLTYLHLGHAVVNQVAIDNIIKYLGPSLHHLILSTPSRLSEEQFMAICRGCCGLYVLGSVGASISFPVLLNGIPLLSKLSELALGIQRGTPSLSRQQIELLKQKCTSLKHISLYN